MTRDITVVEGKIFTVDFSLLFVYLQYYIQPVQVNPLSEQLFPFDMDIEEKLSGTKPGDIIAPISLLKPANI